MSERAVVLSLVERGWQAARECSLDLQQQGHCVIHVVKGRLSRSVRGLIEPKPHVRIVSVHHRLFWLACWLGCAWLVITGRLRSLLVDNERSYRRLTGWARMARLNLALVRMGAQGYELWNGPTRITRSAWREALQR